jgi:hypothetical protein
LHNLKLENDDMAWAQWFLVLFILFSSVITNNAKDLCFSSHFKQVTNLVIVDIPHLWSTDSSPQI